MHYSLLVVGARDLDEVHEMLAPYMENCCAEPEKRFMEFYDIEDLLRERYETQMEERVVMPDGSLLSPCDEQFYVRPERCSERGMTVYFREAPSKNKLSYRVPNNAQVGRSEEHTSELQSRQYLVCRLLL